MPLDTATCPCCRSIVPNDLLLSHIFYEHPMTFYLWANFYYPGIFIISDDDIDMDIIVNNENEPLSYEMLSELCDRIGNVKTPIKNYENSTVVSLNKTIECPICLEDTTENRMIKNCSHEYCDSCLKKWFSMNHICPICKRSAIQSQNPIENPLTGID